MQNNKKIYVPKIKGVKTEEIKVEKELVFQLNKSAVFINRFHMKKFSTLIPPDYKDDGSFWNFVGSLGELSIICVEFYACLSFWNSYIKFSYYCYEDKRIVSCCFYFEKKNHEYVNKILSYILECSIDIKLYNQIVELINKYPENVMLTVIKKYYSPVENLEKLLHF
jgi:hypothetical protein